MDLGHKQTPKAEAEPRTKFNNVLETKLYQAEEAGSWLVKGHKE